MPPATLDAFRDHGKLRDSLEENIDEARAQRDWVAERVDAALTLDDPQMLLSKTHIAFGQDADGVWVLDRGSRNGTRVQDPQGRVRPAAPGERVRVPVGWAVHIGGRSFEVVSGGE